MPEHDLEPPRFSRKALECLLGDWKAVQSMIMSGTRDVSETQFTRPALRFQTDRHRPLGQVFLVFLGQMSDGDRRFTGDSHQGDEESGCEAGPVRHHGLQTFRQIGRSNLRSVHDRDGAEFDEAQELEQSEPTSDQVQKNIPVSVEAVDRRVVRERRRDHGAGQIGSGETHSTVFSGHFCKRHPERTSDRHWSRKE
jgi:hypothetical protein